MIQSNLIKFFIILTFFYSVYSFANEKEREELIYMEADNVRYDFKKGIVDYQGNVHAVQGPTDLTANQMIIYYNGKHKIKKIVATGNLAHYKTLINDNKDLLKAAARQIFYYPLDKRVILEQDATAEYNQNQFSGPYIFYDIKNKVISSHPKKNSQTKIILEPIKQLNLK